MMNMSKEELIKLHKSGQLTDKATFNPHAWEVAVIVEIDDEQVFGYYKYMDKENVYFKVKLYGTKKDIFVVNGERFYLGLFLKEGCY